MNIVVIGASGGIGAALVSSVALAYPQARIHATYLNNKPPEDHKQTGSETADVNWSVLDVTSDTAVQDYAAGFDKVHWIINAVGMLHKRELMPEKTVTQIDANFFMLNLRINALPTLLLAKHFKSALASGAEKEFSSHFSTVSARVGSIEDNRLGGWYSYRCSKAALNMAIKNLSIEWRRTMPHICVSALHPGTTDTGLSMPFQRSVPQGKLFTPRYTADCLVQVLNNITAADTGKFFAYDGQEIPW